jgi:hypothetical protein
MLFSGERKTMTGAVAAFAIAVGGTSLICYLLMTRLPNRRARRGSSGNGSGADGGGYGGSDGRSLSHWFGGDHSALDASGNPIDFGGGDSGGGGDGGGDGGWRWRLTLPRYQKSSGFLVRRKGGFFRFILVCVTHHFGIT